MIDIPDPYVPSTEQLVVEVFVRDIGVSLAFYRDLGFQLLSNRGDFIVLAWEGHRLFLDYRPDQPPPPAVPQVNMRIMVPNVDDYWALVQHMGARVFAPIADRDYGLRDFTIVDPDGFGLRFGARLTDHG